MAYIFDFGLFKIRIQEQRDGIDLPSHQCKMINIEKVLMKSTHNHPYMVTFGVSKGNSLNVKTTFTGDAFAKLDMIAGRVLREGPTLSDSDEMYDRTKNNFNIEPRTFRADAVNGVLVNAKGEVFGIFCKVMTGRDTEVEADNVSFDRVTCYREMNMISPNPANPFVHKTSVSSLPDTEISVVQYLIAMEQLIVKSIDKIYTRLDACDRRVIRMEAHFSGFEDFVKQQTNLILSKITERDTRIPTLTKFGNEFLV